MILTKDTFDAHTTGDYIMPSKNRHQLFPHIKDILNNPDEVWLQEHKAGAFKTKYVKFYNKEAVVVRTSIQQSTEALNIDTWYKMKGDESLTRRGLKIK